MAPVWAELKHQLVPLLVIASAVALESLIQGSVAVVGVGLLLAGTLFLAPRVSVVLLALCFALQDVGVKNLESFDPGISSALHSLDEATLAAGLLFVLLRWLRGERSWLRLKDWAGAIAFVLCGLASSALHGQPKPAMLGLLLSCRFFGIILFMAAVPWKERDAERLLTIGIVVTPILAVFGLLCFTDRSFVLRYIANTNDMNAVERGGIVPVMAPFPHPGVFAWAMSAGILCAAVRLLSRRGSRGPAWLAIGFGIVGALLTLRRRPLLAVPAALLVSLMKLDGKRRLQVLLVMGVVATIIGVVGADYLAATVQDTMTSYVDGDIGEKSARFLLMSISGDLAGRFFPLGAGLGRFGTYPSVLYYSDVYVEAGVSHQFGLSPDAPFYVMDTYWPHILGETGVLGLIAMVVFFVAIWRRLGRCTGVAAQLGRLLLLEGIVESFAGPVFDTPLQTFVIAIPIGMALRLSADAADAVTVAADAVAGSALASEPAPAPEPAAEPAAASEPASLPPPDPAPSR